MGKSRPPRHYVKWSNIKARCYNHNHPAYHRYGGRGISMYGPWRNRHGYPAFIKYLDEHLGPIPSPKHSLDRIDNDGNYEPGNLKWSTQREQLLNTRMHKRNNSGYRGVYWDKVARKWITNTAYKGKTIYVGRFDDIEEAAKAYKEAVLALAEKALQER